MKRAITNPLHLLYESMLERVHSSNGGFDSLSEPEKLYYSVALLRNEINNGGFGQYFFNSSGSYYAHAEKGLAELGATKVLELLHQAKEIVLPGAPVPRDTAVRRNLLPVADPDAPEPEWVSKLNELDQRFYADPGDLTPRLEAFARGQGLLSTQAETDS